jgi:hypothetical protein
MANQSDKNKWTEGFSPETNVFLVSEKRRREDDLDPVSSSFGWQKRVVILLWISIALLLLLGGLLLYAGYHGVFGSSPDLTTPFPPGPPVS